MATDTAQSLTTNPATDHAATHNVLSRAAVGLRQFMCGLHGHDTLKHFERGRISLLCASCGYETPGWEVKTPPARPGADSPRVVSMPLVHERRAA
jgi:hypothetical protein